MLISAGSNSITDPRTLSMAFNSPASSLTPAALEFSRTCSGPRGADDGGGHVRVLEHPGDSWLGPGESRLPRQQGQLQDCSQHRILEPRADDLGATALIRGTGCRRWNLAAMVLAAQDGLGDRRPLICPMPSAREFGSRRPG